jgi:hypothetical protein
MTNFYSKLRNLNISVVTFPRKMKLCSTKLAKFSQILGILKNTFKPTLIQKFSRIRINNELALPILLYGNEIWALRKKDKKQ